MRFAIFTDLDGSLLNQEDYTYAEAVPTLEKIRAAGIPLVIVTSKTRTEVEHLQTEMNIADPFITENGGGIFFPDSPVIKGPAGGEKDGKYFVIRLGAAYGDIRKFFVKASSRFAIRGFGDMTAAEIADLAGLSDIDAERARCREFTEPFLAENESDVAEMERMARNDGFKITKGGRFFHLIGIGQDKGIAVEKVIDIFQEKENQERFVTIGIGDSENDLPMLRQVDIPVLIPRPRHGFLDVQMPGLVRAREPGARGWNSAVGRILTDFGNGCLPEKPIS